MAGQYYTGTLLASTIVRGSSGDTYGTHHSVLGVGGYMEVATIADRNRIPVDTVNGIYYDGLSSGQRRLGMLVHVYENKIVYHFLPSIPYSTWITYTDGQKMAVLTDNSNWKVFLSSGGSTGGGENISKSFVQNTPGFVVGDVVGFNGVDYQKVDTSSANTVEPLGLITKIIGLDGFTITYAGYVSTAGIVDNVGGALIPGKVYYLGSIGLTPNSNLTLSQPAGLTDVSKPMLVTLSGNTGIVLQYRGLSKSKEGVSYEVFTGYTASTKVELDKTVSGATNIGFMSGKTGVQRINILTSVPSYNGNYTSVYNNYYRDSGGTIQIGAPGYHGTLRRGYVSDFTPKKSWLYNYYTGNANKVGWILVDGDITTSVSTQLNAGNLAANAGTPTFNQVEWSDVGGVASDGYYTNNALSLDVNGSLHTGGTYNVGGPVYSDKQYHELRFRTIMSKSPSTIKVTYDSNFVYISGATGSGSTSISGVTGAVNIGTGLGVYSNITGTTLQFKSIAGSGNTTISQVGDTIIISSTGGGESASGERVTKRIYQPSHGFSTTNVIGWSGGTYNKAIADGTYDGEVLGIVSKVIDIDYFDLTQTGYVSGLTGLTTNSTYFLSDTIPGGLSFSAPSTDGYISKAVLIASSPTSAWILAYPGYTVATGSTGSGSTGGGTYNLKSPSTCTVGGIPSGTILTGKSAFELFEQLLVPELYGTVVNPSVSISLSQSGIREIGSSISQTVTGNFSRGSINPQYCSASPYRSAGANAYCFTGSGMPSGFQACTALSASQNNPTYTVVAGTQTWGVCTSYDAGSAALGSNGTQYCAALSAGCTLPSSNSITGILPWYWGTKATGVITGSDVAAGTKTLAVVGASTPIIFNATSQYLWFAAPQGTYTTKTKWWVCASNASIIGGVGQLWANACSVAVTTGLWSGCLFDVYVTCAVTTTDTGVPMCLYY